MKKLISVLLLLVALLGLLLSAAMIFLNTDGAQEQLYQTMVFTAIFFALLFFVCILSLILRSSKQIGAGVAVFVVLLTLIQAGLLLSCYMNYRNAQEAPKPVQTAPATTAEATEQTIPTTEETVPPTTEETIPYQPLNAAPVADTDPSVFKTQWDIMANGEKVDSYTREDPISFTDDDYFALPGIATFRSSNHRTNAFYGVAEIVDAKLTTLYSKSVGANNDPHWCGCGWTGQPLVVQWDAETKAIMNLYPEAKAKEDLIEVIYAKMDGKIHFFDMVTGEPTRDPINVGMCFKGAGAIDPRGYPLMYAGSGINETGKPARMYIISLITGEILWEQSGKDSFTNRGWYAFDSSPLVDADTDTLIWPGENGILYTFKLNTQYDKAAGTISVAPDNEVKARYSNKYSNAGRSRGYEGSAVVVDNYLYVGENGGMMHCVDLNTMDIVWTQDVKDDVNSTALFDREADGKGYIYVSPSLEYLGSKADMSIYKLDAETGEIVWTYTMTCNTTNDISGGALASPILGQEGTDLEGLIIFTMGRTPSLWTGRMLALDKVTGEVVWETSTGNYAWSSPVAIYTAEGKSYIFQADASGNCSMYDGATGTRLTTLELGQTVEASPVVFNNYMVLGTRSGIYGFKIS